jgi:hypothetical protein
MLQYFRDLSVWASEQALGNNSDWAKSILFRRPDWRFTCSSWLSWEQVIWQPTSFLFVSCNISLWIIQCYICWPRSPIADPKSKGVIYGLTLDTSDKQLALLYLATVQGIAYGTRHIVEHCNAHGHQVRMHNAMTHIWSYYQFFGLGIF